MYEYSLRNINDGSIRYAFGYSLENALKRGRLEPKEWEVEFCDYVD